MENSGNGRLFAGGFIGASVEDEGGSDGRFGILEADILLGYQRDDFLVGLGAQVSHHVGNTGDTDENIQFQEAGYFFVGVGNLTATLAFENTETWEASNIFPQNLLGFSDIGSARDELFRLDWAINERHHLAFSTDFDNDDDWAIGYQGRFGGIGSFQEFIITAAAEYNGGGGVDEYGFIITAPINEWAFQFIYTADDRGDSSPVEYGIGIHRDFGDRLTLGAIIETSTGTGDDGTYGIVGRYQLNEDLIFHAEVFENKNQDESRFKVGFVRFFGDDQPFLGKRSHVKETSKWLTDF